MARAIERLWQDAAATRALGDAARSFAASHCGEDAAVAYFENYLRTRAGWPTAGRRPMIRKEETCDEPAP
jgi:hypothetical protein